MTILVHKRLERCVKMGNVLSGESKQLLKDVLHQNSDVFAWPGVGVNLHGLLELDKSGLNGNKDRVQLDLICPSTYQLLWNSSGDFRPNLSFDKSASLERLYFAFGRHLEEIHMTWAHLEKKRIRLRTYTTLLKNLSLEAGDGVTDYT
ncbi:hypothetical protein Tco_0299338 [Tanacetum coccineum]